MKHTDTNKNEMKLDIPNTPRGTEKASGATNTMITNEYLKPDPQIAKNTRKSFWSDASPATQNCSIDKNPETIPSILLQFYEMNPVNDIYRFE